MSRIERKLEESEFDKTIALNTTEGDYEMDNIDILNYSIQFTKRELQWLQRGIRKIINQDIDMLNAACSDTELKRNTEMLLKEINLLEKIKGVDNA